MGVKKLKNTLDNREHNCSWCGDTADWVSLGCLNKKFSCPDHKPLLDDYFHNAAKIPREKDNGHRSEADYQTWMRT